MELKASRKNYCPIFRDKQLKTAAAESFELDRKIQKAVKKNRNKLINSEIIASKAVLQRG